VSEPYRVPPPPRTVEVIDEDEAAAWRHILAGQIVLHRDGCPAEGGGACECELSVEDWIGSGAAA
jgi:hypothetical protein